MIDKKQYNVIITLGVIIRGETPHFEYIANECVHGISQLAIKTGVPIILGVLTVNNRKQAMNRSENQSIMGKILFLGKKLKALP